MPNAYLAKLRQDYDTQKAAIAALQQKALDENRDLTDEEMTSVRGMSESCEKLHTQITQLTDIEVRDRKVQEEAARIISDADRAAVDGRADPVLTRVGGHGQHPQVNPAGGTPLVGNARAVDRDPGHYTRSAPNSFFGDLHRARHGDDDAARRLVEHNRALSTGTGNAGAGVVPPHWLSEEFELLARQGRALASAVRNIGLGSDPRPLTLPKQLTGTDAEVVEQSAENDATEDDDAWTSDVDTVTPKPTAGIQIVSRQMLDMSSPAIDSLIYGDMIAAYNLKIEKKVGAAMVTAASTAVTTFATEAAFNTDQDASDAVIDTAIAVRNARKLPADIVAMGIVRYGAFLKFKDADGRPLIPEASNGPMNAIGVGTVAVDGRMHGLGIIATDGVSTGSYPESILVARAADTILFESDTLRFRYEEPLGPESVKLGIWGYSAVIVRQAGKSVKRIVVTAAA
jgi:HK97 family phage major capsid protein